ncbi:MAG: FN3 associated domain-containing protein [Thermoguttaceae bacterium]
MKVAPPISFFLFLLFIATTGAAASEAASSAITSPNLQIHIDPAHGTIVGMTLGGETSERAVTGGTVLVGCRLVGIRSRGLAGGSVEIEKDYIDETGRYHATLVERLLPTNSSVRWEIEVRGTGQPWTAPIETRLTWPDAKASLFWTAWGDPRPNGSDWTDPLQPAAWADREFLYGGHSYFKEPGAFSLPVATIIDNSRDTGVSIVASPEDLILTMKMRTTRQGELAFSREYHRFVRGNVVRCAYDLTTHPADWRCGVAWLVGRYPAFFAPPNQKADQIAGCGAYTSDIARDQAERLMRMAFRINWRASFDFPYMGMFIPPVASDTRPWTSFKGAQTSIAQMRRSAEELRQMGFYLLNYFNVTEFGAHAKFPPPPRRATNNADLWKDANDFLHGRMSDAILPGRDGKAIGSWEGCVAMDCGEPVHRDFLIDQARKHVEKFPASAGICIDRMDWLWCYNRRRDDGVTWYEGGPARSLVISWHKLMDRMAPVFHDAGKVIFGNPMYARLDLMRQLDGLYDEHGQHPHSINTCSLLALRKPYIAWTWELDDIKKNPDAYIQRHLYLGAFLTAPVPNNDHTILPDAKLDRLFFDYGPMMDTLRGKHWVLLPHVVSVPGAGAVANLFAVPGGYVVPVMLGGKATSAEIVLRGLPTLPGHRGFRIEALRPGREQPVELAAVSEGNCLRIGVPLNRGCAMLLLTHTWMSPSTTYFYGSARVEVGTMLEGSRLHYTLDGSKPTAQSPVYNTPIELKRTTVVKAAVFRGDKKVSQTLEREYVELSLHSH